MTKHNKAMMWEGKPVFAVYAIDLDRLIFLDFACGNPKDIEVYFEDRSGYGLELKPVNPLIIEEGLRHRKNKLLLEKEKLEKQLAVLNDKLRAQ